MFKTITPARFAACLVYAFNPRGNPDCRNTLDLAVDDSGVEDELDVIDAIYTLDLGMGELQTARR